MPLQRPLHRDPVDSTQLEKELVSNSKTIIKQAYHTAFRCILEDNKLFQNRVLFVPWHQDDQFQLVLNSCVDALDRVVQAAVANSKNDRAIPLCQRNANCRRRTPA